MSFVFYLMWIIECLFVVIDILLYILFLVEIRFLQMLQRFYLHGKCATFQTSSFSGSCDWNVSFAVSPLMKSGMSDLVKFEFLLTSQALDLCSDVIHYGKMLRHELLPKNCLI